MYKEKMGFCVVLIIILIVHSNIFF